MFANRSAGTRPCLATMARRSAPADDAALGPRQQRTDRPSALRPHQGAGLSAEDFRGGDIDGHDRGQVGDQRWFVRAWLVVCWFCSEVGPTQMWPVYVRRQHDFEQGTFQITNGG